MKDILLHKIFYNSITTAASYEITPSYIQIGKDASVLDTVEGLGFEVEKLHDNDRILLSQDVKVYADKDAFLKSFKEDYTNILIFNNGNPISYIEGKVYESFVLTENNFLFSNSISYLDFQKKLKDLEREIDGSFNFVDSYNRDSRKIIFVSLAEKSRLIICHDIGIPNFNEKDNYTIGYDKFLDCFEAENKTLPRFLKSALINVSSNYDSKNRMKQLFENLSSIVLKAKLNFEVYLNELSLDKIKKEYDDIKTKYFNNLSDVLTKLTNNILALPVAIAALLFSIEKIKQNPLYLLVLIIILIVTSVYLSFLLRVYYKDLNYTKKVFDRDYSFLIENNFFNKYPDEKVVFEEIKERIYDRIRFLNLVTKSYFLIMNIANIVIISIILYHLGIVIRWNLIIGIMLVALCLIFGHFILRKEKSEMN
jgi:hypothetical protein